MVIPHQLVLLIHVYMVLVAGVRFSVLSRCENNPPDYFLIFLASARINVLLEPFGRLLSSIFGHLAVLDRVVSNAGIVIARHRDDRGKPDCAILKLRSAIPHIHTAATRVDAL